MDYHLSRAEQRVLFVYCSVVFMLYCLVVPKVLFVISVVLLYAIWLIVSDEGSWRNIHLEPHCPTLLISFW